MPMKTNFDVFATGTRVKFISSDASLATCFPRKGGERESIYYKEYAKYACELAKAFDLSYGARNFNATSNFSANYVLQLQASFVKRILDMYKKWTVATRFKITGFSATLNAYVTRNVQVRAIRDFSSNSCKQRHYSPNCFPRLVHSRVHLFRVHTFLKPRQLACTRKIYILQMCPRRRARCFETRSPLLNFNRGIPHFFSFLPSSVSVFRSCK